MDKILTSSKHSDDFSTGLDRNRDRRRRELTVNKNIKGKFHVRIMRKDIFGYAEHQQKATFGLGYKLTLTTNNDSAVLNKDNAVKHFKIKIISIEWLVPLYTPSMKQQDILMNQTINEKPTDIHYVKRSVFMQEVKNQKLWQFQIGVEEGINIPILILIGFQQQDRENSQNLIKDTSGRLPVTSAQCIIGTEIKPDSAILLNYDDDDCSHGYHQIKEVFRA